MRPITRRSLLAATVSATAGTSACAASDAQAASVAAEPALNARARHRGLFFGAAVGNDTLTTDPAAMAHVDTECGMVVGEASFKWADIHPEPDRYDYTRSDALMEWAIKRDIRVRGHTLVWHEGNPEWLEPAVTPASAEKILVDHIKNVAGHYANKLVHWDVINELIDVADKQPGSLRNTFWYKALGPAYIDIALHATKAHDPHALRVINEYGTDYAIPWQDHRRGALLDLLSDLTHRGVPVQAVGLQAHLDAGETTLDQKVLSTFVADIASMGLKIIVTEFDVRDQRLPADIPSRDTAVAAHGRAWLDAVLPNPDVLGVLSWGLSDRRSWLNGMFARADGLPQRPLPLDVNLNRKKLWSSMAGAFDAAPIRGAAKRA